jgi:hypothetical protein
MRILSWTIVNTLEANEKIESLNKDTENLSIANKDIRYNQMEVLFMYLYRVLEFELRASFFLGRYSSTWAKPPTQVEILQFVNIISE